MGQHDEDGARRHVAAAREMLAAAIADGDAQGALTIRLMEAILTPTLDTLNAARQPPPVAIPALAESQAYVAVSCVGQAAEPGHVRQMMETYIALFAEEARRYTDHVESILQHPQGTA